MSTVGFLHTAAAGVATARDLLAAHAPWIRDVHLVDETLAGPAPAGRLAARVGELAGRDVDVLVCVDPALLADVRRVAARSGLAVVGLDQLATGPLALAG